LAAGLVLWWRPREETLAGLGFGVAIGYLMGEQFRANRQRKKALQRVLGTEWHDLVEEAPECKALMRNTVYWVRRMDAESLHWINDIISALWPFNNEAIRKSVVSTLEPVLDTYKPSFVNDIYFREFTLGENPFQAHHMRMVRDDHSKQEIEFAMDVRWNGDVSIKLAVSALGTGKICQVKVKRVTLIGTVRVLLRPFVDELPCFGSVSVSFVEPPSIDFDLQMTGALVFTNPIELWIKPLVRDYVQDYYVWPQRMVVPMFGEDVVPSHSIMPCIRGILWVKVVQAEGLRAADLSGKSDPFVVAHTLPLRQFHTSIKEQTLNPVWEGEETYFRILEESQYLYVEVRDHDTVTLGRILSFGGAVSLGGGSGARGQEAARETAEVLGRARIGPLDQIPGLVWDGELVDEYFELGEQHWTAIQEDGTRGPGSGSGRIRLQLRYMSLEELRGKGKAAALPRDDRLEAQRGLLFCHAIRGLNVGEGAMRAVLSVPGQPTSRSKWARAVTASAEGEAGADDGGGGEGGDCAEAAPVTSEVTWLSRAAFIETKSDLKLSVQVLKQRRGGPKSLGWIDIPLALPAGEDRPGGIKAAFELEGVPNDPAMRGAAVELELEWVPLDDSPVPSLLSIYEGMGTLMVRLCHARGLRKTHAFGSAGVFCDLRVGAKKRHRSSTMQGTRSPEWMEEFAFPRVAGSNGLLLSVVGGGLLGGRDLAGEVSVPIEAVRAAGGALSGTWMLHGTKRGSVCMDLTWLPYGEGRHPFFGSEQKEPSWPEAPVEELVPPLTEAKAISADVRVELRAARLEGREAEAADRAAGIRCRLCLKDSERFSRASRAAEPSWTETFEWESVNMFDVLDVTVLEGAGGEEHELGSASVELQGVIDAAGSLEGEWALDSGLGAVSLRVGARPEEKGRDRRARRLGECLNVTLRGASGLEAKDVSGSSDPKCFLQVGDEVLSSTTKWQTLDPEWEEHFQFVDIEDGEVLEIRLVDRDRVGADEPLGHAFVDLSELPTGPVERTLKLQGCKSGEVRLRLHRAGRDDRERRDAVEFASNEAKEGTGGEAVVGILKMQLHAAFDLPKPKGAFASMDCYAKATVGCSDAVYRSPVVHKTCNPEWDGEKFSFEDVAGSEMLRVRLADKKPIGRDIIGHAVIPVKEAAQQPGIPIRKRWPCTSEKGELVGSVELTLEFQITS